MWTEDELTTERIETMIGALEDEAAQVKTALAQAKEADVGSDDDKKRLKRLESRTKAIAAELEKWKGKLKPKSSGRGKKAVEVEDAPGDDAAKGAAGE